MDKTMQVFILLAFSAICANSSRTYTKEDAHNVPASKGTGRSEVEKQIEIVSREEWGAQPPKRTTEMRHPVPYVIIHHSYIPAACHTADECDKAMQTMQEMHQDVNKWDDIGYNFGIGGDGRIYMGRGWSNCGAHAPTYNNVSIGICFIGDWTKEVPPAEMTDRAHELIAYGVNQGYIHPEYELYGHRQVRDTECPGNAFYENVTGWPHWGEKAPRRVTRRPPTAPTDSPYDE